MKNYIITNLAIALLLCSVHLVQSQEKREEISLPELSGVSRGDSTNNSVKIDTISPDVSYFDINDTIVTPVKNAVSLRASTAITSAVGEITMLTDVAPNGSMTVNIPIEFPKGVGDFRPQISLVYNHLSGNGVAGAGWNISGLFPVTARNQSIYYDSKTDIGDPLIHLLWEGKRLIPTETTTSYRRYKLESSNLAVTAQYASNALSVFDGHGNTYSYTYDPNNYSFRLVKITDRHGNYISYSYRLDNNVYYVSQITYGGNQTAGTGYTQSVTFVYESRTDQMLAYNYGQPFKVTLRLKTITTSEKTYTLNYTNSYYSLFSSLNCTLKNGSLTQNLEPLVFSYGANIPSSGNLTAKSGDQTGYFSDGNSSTIYAVTGKFSADEEEEGFVTYPNKAPYQWGKKEGTNYYALYSMYQPSDKILIAPTYSKATTVSSHPYVVTANEGFRGIVTLNADDIPQNNEIVLINAVGGYTDPMQIVSFRIFSKTNTNTYGVTKTVSFSLPAAWQQELYYTSVTPISYQTGNFKGDGVERILGIQQANTDGFYSFEALILFDLKTAKYYSYTPSFSIDINDKVIALDYDGDGKTDLFHFHNTGFNVYRFDPTNPASTTDMTFTLTQIASSSAINRNNFDEESTKFEGGFSIWHARRNILFGDINGDGKTDILKTAQYGVKGLIYGEKESMNGDTWTQVLSAGSGTFVSTTYTMPAIWLNTYNDVLMHDFNGDGRADVVCLKDGKLQVIHSNGSQIDNTLLNSYPLTGYEDNGKLFTIGINYSNHNRVVGYIKNQTIAKLSIDRSETAKAFLTCTQTSHKVSTHIDYKRIDDKLNTSYSPGSGAQFPFENYNGYLWTVRSLEKKFNNITIANLGYSYDNAVVHKQGLGFCGFEQVTISGGVVIRNQYTTYDPFHLGVVKEIDADDQKTVNTYNFAYTGNKEPVFRLTKQNITDKKTGNVITVSHFYDEYGNLTDTGTEYDPDLLETSAAIYLNSVTPYTNQTRVGFPLITTKESYRGNDYTWTSTHFTYNNNRLLPDVITEKINDHIVSQTEYYYDVFSNVTKKSVTPYEATAYKLSNEYKYDNAGIKLTELKDERGNTTKYDYTGNLVTSIIDTRGKTTGFEYDAAGRIFRQTNPDGTLEETYYTYENEAVYAVTKASSTQPTTTIRYDGLHRVFEEERQALHTSVRKATEYYDYPAGRTVHVSLPYTTVSPSLWDIYTYDKFDQLTSVKYASGKTDTYTYSGNSVTSVIDGVTSTKVFDKAGHLIQATDAGGTIEYNLRADGQPSFILAPYTRNSRISFTYDIYNRRTAIFDPSAGMQTYTYDTRGNILTEKDARGMTTTYSYDNFNRLYQKIRPEFTTTYAYDKFGETLSKTSSNGHAERFVYDEFGRLSLEKDSIIDGNFLQKDYTYTDGRVSKINYSSQTGSIEGENFFYTNNHVEEIKLNDGRSLWKLISENEFGQPLSLNTGGSMTNRKTYGYDPYGYPTSIKIAYSSTVYCDLSYNFNPVTGNLVSRKDNKRNLLESFSYDNLDRLTTYGLTQNQKTVTYDYKGNITNKSDAGSFQHYDKPYAISEAWADTTRSILLRAQNISYTSFKRPSAIMENGYLASFSYNGNEERSKMVVTKNGNPVLTRYYISDCYEKDVSAIGNVSEKLYLCGDFYTAGVVLYKHSAGDISTANIHRDYQGSMLQTCTSIPSNVMNCDAWGNRRNPLTGVNYDEANPAPESSLGRGYGGHEHLPWFGLINMNARLYEPATGRFLSPDPYVQMPDFSQSFNRYSYCLNNPLKYTDPSGELWWLVPMVIGGAINWATHGCDFTWEGLSYFGVGAAAGATSLLAVTGVGTALVPAAAGAVLGAGNSYVEQGFAGGNGNTWDRSNVDWGQVGIGGISGAITGYVGGQMASKLTPYVSKYVSGLIGKSPVLQDMITNSVVSGTTGFTVGAGWTAINGGSFKESMQAGWSSAKVGLAVGGATGALSGFQRAQAENVNWLTGRSNVNVTAEDLGLSTTMDRIQAGERYPHRNDGKTFINKEGILPLQQDPNYYKEYVHPTQGISGPGAQRIVIGGNKYYYYSPDHYKTFIRFKY